MPTGQSTGSSPSADVPFSPGDYNLCQADKNWPEYFARDGIESVDQFSSVIASLTNYVFYFINTESFHLVFQVASFVFTIISFSWLFSEAF